VIELVEEFPFTIDPSSNSVHRIRSGTYTKDYSSTFMAPFKVRINEDALDGETPIKIRYKNVEKMFNIEIQDIRANFEIFVDDFELATNTITFEVLNLGDENIEAVTVEIPTQDGVKIYGANRENIGDLSSNEATTSDFRILTDKESIDIIIYYSDITNTRRSVEQTITLNLSNFNYPSDNKTSPLIWVLLVIVGIILFFFIKKRYKKNKKV